MGDLFSVAFSWGSGADDPGDQPAPRSAVAAKPEPDASSVATIATVARDQSVDWRTGISRFLAFSCPPIMTIHRWRELQADARGLATLWASDLFGLGWSVPEVFGWHPRPWVPHAGEPSGLIRYLKGCPISAVDANTATIEQRGKGALTFRRHDPAMNIAWDRSTALPIWQAFNPEYLAFHAL